MIYGLSEADDSLLLPGRKAQASSIHTLLHNIKTQVRERLECPNADGVNEHSDMDGSTPGVHVATKIGFVRVSTWDDRTQSPKAGTLHYITEPNERQGLYLGDAGNSLVPVNPTYHSGLIDLTDEDAHLQYQLIDFSRALTGDMTIVGSLTLLEGPASADHHALQSEHVDKSWHSAHGANSVTQRIIKDDTVPLSAISHTLVSGTVSDWDRVDFSGDLNAIGCPVTSASGDDDVYLAFYVGDYVAAALSSNDVTIQAVRLEP